MLRGHGIHPSRMPGMATAYPPHRQPGSPDRTMQFHRLAGVVGTGRGKAALIPHKWRKKDLVSADQDNQSPLDNIHGQSLLLIAGGKTLRVAQIFQRIDIQESVGILAYQEIPRRMTLLPGADRAPTRFHIGLDI